MARGRSTAVTVADVAARAGVSVGTASKVLNGIGQLRDETREAVLSAAVELGYASRTLPTIDPRKRTYIVGVLTTDSIGRFTLPILAGAEDALGAGQMSMLLCESRGDPIREQHYLRVLLARRIDGLIITGRSSDVRDSIGRDFPVPVVYALGESADPDDLSIISDEVGAGAVATRHILNMGRSRIVHITGAPIHAGVAKRLKGVEQTLHEQGLELATAPLHGDWSERWGREAVMQLSRNQLSYDGIVCGSDQIARGVTDALREREIAVPSTVSVVGIDNWDVMVEGSQPELTTVDLNLKEIGHLAATKLLEMISAASPVSSGQVVVPCRLVVRGSTAIVSAARSRQP
jgi:LacI family transcriptional regulator